MHIQEEPTPNPSWIALHHQLQEEMQKEVYLMRELLSNMHQEEISLMLHDKGSLNPLLEQRSMLLEKLSSLKINKLKTLEQIAHLTPYSSTPLEISSLDDQLTTLTEKVHRQVTTNQRLNLHPDYPMYPLAEQKRAKKKAMVATLQIKK